MADTTLKEGTRLDGLLNDHILYTDGGSEICGLAEHDAALIHKELRALRDSHDAFVAALETAFGLTVCFIELQAAIKAKDVDAANMYMALVRDADKTLERALAPVAALAKAEALQ